ncbi:MAG: sulfite exporter TauE/SafE family protein [Planctomycetaceae bacterium]|nr:sulfite exporter TauE/SafE family protein [Planctomycetaceae bacterium]
MLGLADPLTLLLVLSGTAFIAKFLDTSIGMGYGTALTPVLLLAGFEPLAIVPAVLASELGPGLLAALAHHRAGNARLIPHSLAMATAAAPAGAGAMRILRHALPMDLKIALFIAFTSIAGTGLAVLLAVKINKMALEIYIGSLVAATGVYLLASRHTQRALSIGRLAGLSLVASFNKGLSGGGYGAIITGGQIITGVEGRNAVAITSLCKSLTSIVGFGLYLLTHSVSQWPLVLCLCIGAVLSVPLGAAAVKRAHPQGLKVAISIACILLGALTLIKTFVAY